MQVRKIFGPKRACIMQTRAGRREIALAPSAQKLTTRLVRVRNANGRWPVSTLNRPSCPSQRIVESTRERSFAQRESAALASSSNSANFLPGGLSPRTPAGGSGVPQSPQNFLPSGFAAPQLGRSMPHLIDQRRSAYRSWRGPVHQTTTPRCFSAPIPILSFNATIGQKQVPRLISAERGIGPAPVPAGAPLISTILTPACDCLISARGKQCGW